MTPYRILHHPLPYPSPSSKRALNYANQRRVGYNDLEYHLAGTTRYEVHRLHVYLPSPNQLPFSERVGGDSANILGKLVIS